LKILEIADIFVPLFRLFRLCITFDKNVLGYILVDFSTNPSGHPVGGFDREQKNGPERNCGLNNQFPDSSFISLALTQGDQIGRIIFFWGGGQYFFLLAVSLKLQRRPNVGALVLCP
jgi:hypothetical protein